MSVPLAAVTSMRVRLLAGASIEIVARDTTGLEELRACLPRGTRVYLPSLPAQSADTVLDAARAVRNAGFEPVPHVAARAVASRAELGMFLRAAHAESAVRRVLLIAGDLTRPCGPFADSLAVLRAEVMAAAGIAEVGIAGYPEGHPDVALPQLELLLGEKLALALGQGLRPTVVTQFSFAPSRVVEYCARLARTHPEVRVRAGIAGPTDPISLARYARRCGVNASRQALRRLGAGMARLVVNTDPRDQVIALARYGETHPDANLEGIHFYGFGGARRTARWLRDTREQSF